MCACWFELVHVCVLLVYVCVNLCTIHSKSIGTARSIPVFFQYTKYCTFWGSDKKMNKKSEFLIYVSWYVLYTLGGQGVLSISSSGGEMDAQLGYGLVIDLASLKTFSPQ